MAGLESVSQRSVVLDARTGQPVSAEQYYKLSKMVLDPAGISGQNTLERTPQQDVVSFASNKSEKVTFGEGVKLIAKGFVGKVSDMFKAIIQHPVKTLGSVALTTLGLAALPLIGISMATGASALALGFAVFAVGKTIVHTANTIKHNNNGEYNEVRKDLGKIGGDGLDLALSLPFAPKAFNQIKRQVKFAPGIGFNTDLWNNIKGAKGIGAKVLELQKGNLRIAYHTISNEMGLKVAPDLAFADNAPSFMLGGYNPQTGTIILNSRHLSPIERLKLKITGEVLGVNESIPSLESTLRHELEHFRQNSDIADKVGINTLAEAIEKSNASRSGDGAAIVSALRKKLEKLRQKEPSGILGRIKSRIAQSVFERDIQCCEGLTTRALTKIKFSMATNKLANKFVESQPQSVKPKINQHLYEQAIANNPKLADSSRVHEYMKAINDYSFADIRKGYLDNILEKEAFGVQDQYIQNVIKGRPGMGTVLAQEVAAMNNPEHN